MSGRWVPGAIPSARQGWWKLVSDASSDEILGAIAWDESKAREADGNGDTPVAAIHWKRWAGLHSAYVRALAKEIRARFAAAVPADTEEQETA